MFCIYVLFAGKNTREVKCKRKDDKSIVADKICEKGKEKPQVELPCNTQACTPRYVNRLCSAEVNSKAVNLRSNRFTRLLTVTVLLKLTRKQLAY